MPQLYPLAWFKLFILFNMMMFLIICFLNCVVSVQVIEGIGVKLVSSYSWEW